MMARLLLNVHFGQLFTGYRSATSSFKTKVAYTPGSEGAKQVIYTRAPSVIHIGIGFECSALLFPKFLHNNIEHIMLSVCLKVPAW